MRSARSGALALVIGVLLATSMATPAVADSYPTWGDVLAAKKSESATKAEITKLTNALAAQQQELDAAKAATETAGATAEAAQNKVDAQAIVLTNLQSQAEAAKQKATASRAQAGQSISELYRSNNGDVTTSLLFSGEGADNLLYQLEVMSTVATTSQAMYEQADQDSKAEQALASQATVAKQIFDTANAQAQADLKVAQQAQNAYQAKLDASVETRATLQAQLSVLTKKRKATQADYQAGVRARAAAAAAAGGHGSSSPSLDGWANPLTTSAQWISSPYGWRVDPFNSSRVTFHNGTDIAVACGTPVYAASAGTIVYAGSYGSLGNIVQIKHDGGAMTLYGHLQSVAHYGGSVDAGQYIAKSGTTGASTGCHLYFRVTVNGVITNPQPFMSARGITLGRAQ